MKKMLATAALALIVAGCQTTPQQSSLPHPFEVCGASIDLSHHQLCTGDWVYPGDRSRMSHGLAIPNDRPEVGMITVAYAVGGSHSWGLHRMCDNLTGFIEGDTITIPNLSRRGNRATYTLGSDGSVAGVYTSGMTDTETPAQLQCITSPISTTAPDN